MDSVASSSNTQPAFEHWCVVELMGHQRIAGKVTEQNLFGTALMRVDVPEIDGRDGFTKFYGATAIYAVTPVEEAVARAIAKSIDTRPVEEWQLRALLPKPKYDDADTIREMDASDDHFYDDESEDFEDEDEPVF
jgi:hypothetical protein